MKSCLFIRNMYNLMSCHLSVRIQFSHLIFRSIQILAGMIIVKKLALVLVLCVRDLRMSTFTSLMRMIFTSTAKAQPLLFIVQYQECILSLSFLRSELSLELSNVDFICSRHLIISSSHTFLSSSKILKLVYICCNLSRIYLPALQ